MASQDSQWWIYMVETASGKLYTGITTDVDRRFAEHSGKQGNKGAKFFRSDKPREIVYKEESNGRSEASKREAEIKKLSRREKCLLAGLSYRPVKKRR